MTPEQIKDILAAHDAWRRGEAGGVRASLRGADLSDASLTRANLSGADLSGADLRGASLRGADLSDASLTRANLSGADLSGADLRGADLRDASLTRADLSDASLSGASLGATRGIRHVSVTADWHGECRRQILAVDHGGEGVIIHCGCFRGGWDALDQYIADNDTSPRVTASRRAIAGMLRVLWDAREEYA